MKTFNCTHGNNGDSPTELTREDIDDIRTALINEIPDSEEIVEGASPILERFIGLFPPELENDIRSCSVFISIDQYYSISEVIRENEIGRIGSIICLLEPSTVTKKDSSLGARVYCMPVVCLLPDTKEYKKFIKDLKVGKDMNAVRLYATRKTKNSEA